MIGLYNRPTNVMQVCEWAAACRPAHARISPSAHQNDTVVVSVTSRGSPTAMIRLLLLDG